MDFYNALNSSAIRAYNLVYSQATTSTRFRFWTPESSSSAARFRSDLRMGCRRATRRRLSYLLPGYSTRNPFFWKRSLGKGRSLNSSLKSHPPGL